MSGKILPLPESVRSQLRSGITITSVAQCVEELVLNSLDAEATCVAARIDLSIFRIQIVDNGNGIQHRDLKLLGSRHATSKCHTLDDLSNNLSHYGFRGEALASIVDVAAIIDITTRSRCSTQTYTKLFAYGKEKSVSPSQTQRPSVGTTITIQDFMYNMPVRRKLIKEAIDIESIRMRLESFALMHPRVSFSLRNDSKNTKILQASKSNCVISTFMQLFGSERAQGLVDVYHSVDQFTISGYISTQPHMTKSLQFVYVNKRVVLKTKIHKLMNELLARSSIISNRLHPATPVPGKTPSSPPKGLRLYGIFVINIECPLSDYDICLDPNKTLVEFKDWDKLLLCIEELIVKFIQEENLVISLDERYRRSGRDQVVDDDDSSPVPHSSQALLQVFSLKRSGDTRGVADAPREKYGRTLCVQDNLSAVHSVPVKRTNKIKEKHSGNDNASQEVCDELPALDDDGDLLSCDRVSDNNEKNRHPLAQNNDLSSKLKSSSSKLLSLNTIGKKDVTVEKDVDVEATSQVQAPVKNISDKDRYECFSHVEYIRSIVAKQKENTQGPHDECLSSATVSLLEKEPNVECEKNICSKRDGLSNLGIEASTRKSSLEEFKEIYNAEIKRNLVSELCSTPERNVRGTPVTPPPIKRVSRIHSNDTGSRGSSSIAHSSSRSNATKERSLCKSLSEGMMKHQKKLKSLQILQKFEFQKSSEKTKSQNNHPGIPRNNDNRTSSKNSHSNAGSQEKSLEAVTTLVEVHEPPKKHFGKYVENSHTSQNTTVANVSAVAEVHESTKNQVPVCKNVDDSVSEKSFRFEPVLANYSDNDYCENIFQSHTSINPSVPKDLVSLEFSTSSNEQICVTSSCETLSNHIVPSIGRVNPSNCMNYVDSSNYPKSLQDTEIIQNKTLHHPGIQALQVDASIVFPDEYPSCESYQKNGVARIYESEKEIQSSGEDRESRAIANATQFSSCGNFGMEDFEGDEHEISGPKDTQHTASSETHTELPPTQPFEMGNDLWQNEGPGLSLATKGLEAALSKSKEISIHESQGFSPVFTDETRDDRTENYVHEQDTAICEVNTNTLNIKSLEEQIMEESQCSFLPGRIPSELENSADRRISEASSQDSVQINSGSASCIDAESLFGKSVQCTDYSLQYKPNDNPVPLRTNEGLAVETGCPYDQSSLKVKNTRREALEADVNFLLNQQSFSLDTNLESSANVGSSVPEIGVEIQNSKTLIDSVDSFAHKDALPSNDRTATANNVTIATASNSTAVTSSNCTVTANNVICVPGSNITNVTATNITTVTGSNVTAATGSNVSSVTASNIATGTGSNIHTVTATNISNSRLPSTNINTTSPQGQTLLSPSLHFSQLTLPPDVDNSQPSQSTGLPSTCELLGLSTPVISSFSSCSFERNGRSSFQQINVSEDNNIVPTGEAGHRLESNKQNQKLNNTVREMNDGGFPMPLSNEIKEVPSNDVNFSASDSIMVDAEMQVTEMDKQNEQSTVAVDAEVNDHGESDSLKNVEKTNNVNEYKESQVVSGWKESSDADGKKIYVNLRTGNTSYDPPLVGDAPEWTSSQPLGAPLLKVPLSHEPDYIPFGKDHPRQDFTLTHGFSAFMSWKKKREIKNKSNATDSLYNFAELVTSEEAKNIVSLSDKSSTTLPDTGDERRDDAPPSPLSRETIDALLKDFEADNDSVKWLSKPSLQNEDYNPSNVAQICQLWEAPSFAMDADVLQSEPQVTSGDGTSGTNKGGAVRVYNIVHPYKFSRDMLLSCKVLGQLDNKFIACSIRHVLPDAQNSQEASKLVVLFDQHAVHERVRLETIIEENYEVAESGKRVIRSSMVTPPLIMSLPDDEVRLMMAYSNHFIQRGLHFSKVSTSKVSFHAIPNCLVAREASQLRHRRCQTASSIVESVVRDMCDTLHKTGGVVGSMPKPLLHILNSQACRGAVKFGDELTLTQCQELITSLSFCQLPFQCAHGRPSIVPVVNITHLAKLDKNDNKPNLKKLVAAMQCQESE